MRLILCVGLSLLASTLAPAHSDPAGEVHPRVVATEDGFAVTSENNALEKEDSVYVVTRILASTGELRTASAERIPFREDGQPQFNKLEEEEEGLSVRWGKEWIVVPNYERKHQGSPFLTLVGERSHRRQTLKWKHPDVSEVCDLLIDGDSLYLLVTRLNIFQEASLWIHKFSLRTWSEEAAVCLPKPVTIYVFPICSGLVAHQGSIYVSLVRRVGKNYELVLTGWNGTASRAKETVLARNIDWNTSVSMANRGSDLLIAYHQVADVDAMPLRWQDEREFDPGRGIFFSMVPSFFETWQAPKSTIELLHRDLAR